MILDAFLVAASEADTDAKRACCTFAERLTELAYGKAAHDLAPGSLWNLWPESHNAWGPVAACLLAGVGQHVDALVPGRWHRIQGWRGAPFAQGVTGHTITVYQPTRGVLTLVVDSAARDRAGNVRGPKMQMVDWPSYSSQYKGGVQICTLKE